MPTEDLDVDRINGIAAVIRRYPNNEGTRLLATAIAIYLTPGEPDCPGCTEIVANTIDRVNPDRTMGAGALAEAIWNDLVADDERRLADEVLAENLDHLAGY
jgi:hypothetical protein